VEVLPGQAVPRLELVEPRGEPLSATRDRAVWLLAFRHPVLPSGGPASRPLARLLPLLLRDLPLEVGEGPWERERPRWLQARNHGKPMNSSWEGLTEASLVFSGNSGKHLPCHSK